MANYYYITIKSEKMTQDIAAKIFNKMIKNCRVRYFDYDENQLKYSTRGLIDIRDIIEEYSVNEAEIEIIDEFGVKENLYEMFC